MKKRFLALLLCVVMCASLMTVVSFAETDEVIDWGTVEIKDTDSLKGLEGIAVNTNAGYPAFRITANIKANIVVPEGVKVYMNLNGYTVTNSSAQYVIKNAGTFTLVDTDTTTGTIEYDLTGGAAIYNYGTFTMNAGTVKHGESVGALDNTPLVNNYGTLRINGGNLNSSSRACVANYGSASVYGGNFSGGVGCINNTSVAKSLTVYGGTFDGNSHSIQNYGSMVINGGTFNKYVSTYSVAGTAGKAIINGGTFNSDIRCSMQLKNGNWPDDKAEVIINNATIYGHLTPIFIAENSAYTTTGPEEQQGIITVSGGQYKNDPKNFLASDELCAQQSDDMYVVGEHAYVETNVIKAATNVKAGRAEYTCSNCGKTVVKTIAADPTLPEVEVDWGEVTISCKEDLYELDGIAINMDADIPAFRLQTDVKANIIIAEGTGVYMNLNGHKLSNSSDDAALFTNNGRLTLVDNHLDFTAHGNGTVVFTGNGDAIVSGENAKYSFTAGVFSFDPSKYVTNDNYCVGLKDEMYVVDSHDVSVFVSDNNAKCVVDGTKTATCPNCGATKTVTDEGSANGIHTFKNYVLDRNETCTKDGTRTAKCEHCDATDTIVAEGSAHGHTWLYAGKIGKTIVVRCAECGTVEYQSIFTFVYGIISYWIPKYL